MRSLALIAALVSISACYHGVPDADVADAETGAASSSDDAGDDGSESDGDAVPACSDLPDEADALRRLTQAELVATVESLVGASIPADVRAWMPSDLREDGFSNASESLVVQAVHTEAVLRIAEWARTAVLADEVRRAEIVGCEPTTAQCLPDFIARFARRAYRRTPRDEEIERLHALALAASEPGDPWAPFGVVVEAVLQSPKFLLRPEIGVSEASGRVRIVGAELATRLAFALWGEAPDEALLDLAEAGGLDDTDGMRTVTETMLDDPRAQRGLGMLAEEWFLLPKLDVAQIDVTRFPELTPSLRTAMRTELEVLIGDHMFGDVPFLELYVTEHARVTPELARLYGVDTAPAWRDTTTADGTLAIEFSPADQRGGLLGRAGFLAMGAESWFASPVRRGLNVRTAVLCDRPPPPPPGVEMNDFDDADDPEDAIDAHSNDPACSGCHSMLDPIGHGLDRYDAIGRIRTVDESGDPVREDGTVSGLDPATFAGARELGELVALAPQTSHCAVTRTSDWILARRAGEATACALAEIEGDALARDFRYRDLVLALVTSEPFTTRSREDGGP